MSARLGAVTLYYEGTDESGVWVDSSTGIISTEDEAVYASIGSHYGIKFESRINYGLYNSYLLQYGSSGIEVGTIILPEENYRNSGATSFANFVLTNDEGSNTYMVVRNTNLDFVNTANAASDGYYKYYGAIIDASPRPLRNRNIAGRPAAAVPRKRRR